MLSDFLLTHETEVLELTESKTKELAGVHPSSERLKQGLPKFFHQMLGVIDNADRPSSPPARDVAAIAAAADKGDEPAMATAAGHPEEAELAKSAGLHGAELLRLGYTLSHVVHAYGAMCQAITEIASTNDVTINAAEFHALNRCLDVAIAGAVTQYQSLRDSQEHDQEGRPSGALLCEMQNMLTSANIAFEAIRSGTVGTGGSTGKALEKSLKRLGELIDRSLTEQKASSANH